jgi:hypothetical protein
VAGRQRERRGKIVRELEVHPVRAHAHLREDLPRLLAQFREDLTGVVPEAIASAIASGSATIATVSPAIRSWRRSPAP